MDQRPIVKTCMQGLVGYIYSGMFEAMMLGVKAGVSIFFCYTVIGVAVLQSIPAD